MGRDVIRLIRALSPATEFSIVVAVAFGLPVAASLISLFQHETGVPHHTNQSLIALQIYEAIVLVVVALFLAVRGWSFRRIGLSLSLKDAGIGVLLFLAAYAAFILAWWVTIWLFPNAAQHALSTRVVSQGVWIANAVGISIVNPVFEETLVAGYVISALKSRDGSWLGINVSVGIRLLYHLYQGPLGVIGSIPMGLIFALWFARTGRLWPLIVAHALTDFISIINFIGR